MIFAAGLGTRLKPFTDKHPKALALVNNQSLLERNIKYLQGFGIREVIVNVHHFADQIVEAVETNRGWGSDITISDETDAVLETGGGLLKAADYLSREGNFVVMNADILTDLDISAMIAQHQQRLPLASLAVTNRNSSRALLFHDKRLVGWKNIGTGELKGPIVNDSVTYEEKAFSGIHIIHKSIFDYCTLNGKFSMIDLYLSLCTDHRIEAFDHSGGVLIDVGKPESIAKAEQYFN